MYPTMSGPTIPATPPYMTGASGMAPYSSGGPEQPTAPKPQYTSPIGPVPGGGNLPSSSNISGVSTGPGALPGTGTVSGQWPTYSSAQPPPYWEGVSTSGGQAPPFPYLTSAELAGEQPYTGGGGGGGGGGRGGGGGGGGGGGAAAPVVPPTTAPGQSVADAVKDMLTAQPGKRFRISPQMQAALASSGLYGRLLDILRSLGFTDIGGIGTYGFITDFLSPMNMPNIDIQALLAGLSPADNLALSMLMNTIMTDIPPEAAPETPPVEQPVAAP
jgi:hypothetical protein